MKLINPSVELLEQSPGVQGMYDMIELCGKTSYKSPVKGGEEAEKFTNARVNEGHYAVLEFGTVYLFVPSEVYSGVGMFSKVAKRYQENPYSRVLTVGAGEDKGFYITTNLRVLVENGWTTDLKHWKEPTECHYRRYTARVITNIGVTREMCRHRAFSFCEQSTRYCNYSSNKFDNQVSFVIPAWSKCLHEGILGYSPLEITPKEAEMMQSWFESEKHYRNMLTSGATPQEAREILPLGTATEICVCGFRDAWENFFALRYNGITGKPHPNMLQVATMLHNSFKEKGIQF